MGAQGFQNRKALQRKQHLCRISEDDGYFVDMEEKGNPGWGNSLGKGWEGTYGGCAWKMVNGAVTRDALWDTWKSRLWRTLNIIMPQTLDFIFMVVVGQAETSNQWSCLRRESMLNAYCLFCEPPQDTGSTRGGFLSPLFSLISRGLTRAWHTASPQ